MKPQNSRQFARIAAAIEYLYDHFQEQPELAAVAAHVGVSPAHLQRQFSDWAGVSPKQLLQYISIEHAKTLLAQQHSLQIAALDSGLSGTGRLHDLFIRIEGMTPGEYKQGGADVQIDYTFADSPFGEVCIAATPKGICHMAFIEQRADALTELQHSLPHAVYREQRHPLHQRALQIFQVVSPPPIPLHLKGTPFQLKVWQALLTIPAGRLQSYAALAAAIGQPEAARAVGTAISRNPVALLIPCHRVIRNSGIIGGYRWQRGRKMALLGYELNAAANIK